MKKLLLLSAIVCGTISFASAQTVDPAPSAAKAKVLVTPTDKKIAADKAATVSKAGTVSKAAARPSFMKASTTTPAIKPMQKAAQAKAKVAVKAN